MIIFTTGWCAAGSYELATVCVIWGFTGDTVVMSAPDTDVFPLHNFEFLIKVHSPELVARLQVVSLSFWMQAALLGCGLVGPFLLRGDSVYLPIRFDGVIGGSCLF